MFRGTSALMIRTLREESFRMRSHLRTFGLVSFSCFMLLIAYVSSTLQAAAGLNYFFSLITLELVFLLTVGITLFTGAISEERDQGTLGLLKLTGLNRLALLLGKSTCWLLLTLQLFLMQLPLIALSVTLGGVTLHQILAAQISIAAFTIFLCNLGLFCSLVCRTSRGASYLAGSVLAFYFIGPWFLKSILSEVLRIHPTISDFGLIAFVIDLCAMIQGSSIFLESMRIVQTGYNDDFLSWQVASNLIAGLILFGLAWGLFERCTRNLEPTVEQTGRHWFRWRRNKARDGNRVVASTAERVSLLVWKNPFVWQQFQFTAGGNFWWWLRWGAVPLLSLLIVGGGILLRYLDTGSTGPDADRFFSDFLAGIYSLAMALLIAELIFASARFLGDEYREGTLSTLLIVPRSLGHIVYSKVGGIVLAMVPYLFYLVLSFVIGVLISQEARSTRWMLTDLPLWFLVFVGILHIIAWYSLMLKRGAVGLGLGTSYLVMMVLAIGWAYLNLVLDSWEWIDQGDWMKIVMQAFMWGTLLTITGLLHWLIFRRIRQLGERNVA